MINQIQNFLSGIRNIYESLGFKPEVGEIIKKEKDFKANEISAIIGFVGDFSGQVYVSIDITTAMNLTTVLLGGMEVNEVDELVLSAVGEFLNMIMGNASIAFSEKGVMLDIAPPTVVVGENVIFTNKMLNYQILVESVDLGKIIFDIAIKDE